MKINKKYVTRHAKRYELGGRRHFEKIRLKVNFASRKNSTPMRVSNRSFLIAHIFKEKHKVKGTYIL